jgi:hypothetical protein
MIAIHQAHASSVRVATILQALGKNIAEGVLLGIIVSQGRKWLAQQEHTLISHPPLNVPLVLGVVLVTALDSHLRRVQDLVLEGITALNDQQVHIQIHVLKEHGVQQPLTCLNL